MNHASKDFCRTHNYAKEIERKKSSIHTINKEESAYNLKACGLIF